MAMGLARTAATADSSYPNPARLPGNDEGGTMASASGDQPRIPVDPDVDLGGPEQLGTVARRRPAPPVEPAVVVALGLGGMLGAVSRYALSLALPTHTGRFPWGTLLVNLSGAAALGFVLIVVIEQFPRTRLVRPALGTGFIGAYTTFSTLEAEAALLVRDGHAQAAATYLVASVVAGVMAVWLGMTSARFAVRRARRRHER
jgi:CrcB protein